MLTKEIEFGLENVSKRAKIVRVLYGGKSSGRDFRNHLRSCMVHLGFDSCKADPDASQPRQMGASTMNIRSFMLMTY